MFTGSALTLVQNVKLNQTLEILTAQGRRPTGYKRHRVAARIWMFQLFAEDDKLEELRLPLDVHGLIKVDAELQAAGLSLRA